MVYQDVLINLYSFTLNSMNVGNNIRKIREAKGMAGKEVAISSKMDPAQYSRIENNKTDPSLSSLIKIAKALGVPVADLLVTDNAIKDINSVDKTLMEKISLIEMLDKKEKAAFFTMLDALVVNKRLRENLSSALQITQK